MTDAAIISALAVLALVATCDLFLSLALARRVRMIQEMGSAPAGRSDFPSVGEVVTPFEVTTLDGQTLSEKEFSLGSTLVAFLAVGCEPCVRLKSEILSSPPDEPFIVFVSGLEAGNMPAIASELAHVAKVVWIEVDELVRNAFRVDAYPTVLRVVNGVVVTAALRLRDIGTSPVPA
jgi:hypothetical protein